MHQVDSQLAHPRHGQSAALLEHTFQVQRLLRGLHSLLEALGEGGHLALRVIVGVLLEQSGFLYIFLLLGRAFLRFVVFRDLDLLIAALVVGFCVMVDESL
mmetsp:Transcript_7041/g.11848  ORF Transcript_7041/g.11848 Transcript_7041/m.11848 type:complete len:101 (+) Transcript_7041:769-1071(+)